MSESADRLGFEPPEKALIYAVGVVAGLAVGILVPYLARWASELPWIPFQGPLDLVSSFDSSWAVWGRPLLGAVVGALCAAYVIHQSPVLVVTDDRIEVSERGDTRRIRRTDVAGIYRKKGKLVIENDRGRRLFEGEVEGDKAAVRSAFVSRGYPWEAE